MNIHCGIVFGDNWYHKLSFIDDKRMETLNYLAYFCKNVLSICMNRLTKVMLFSSDRKNTGLACCFLGRINFDGSFCYSRICDKATRNERYAFLFVWLLLLSNTTTYVHCIISCLSSCVTWRFSLFVSLWGMWILFTRTFSQRNKRIWPDASWGSRSDKYAPCINFILPLDNKQFFHNAI